MTDLEDKLLGPLHHDGRIIFGLIGRCCDLCRCPDEATKNGRALDDPGVEQRVAAGGNLVDERGDVTGSSHFLEFRPALQHVADGDEIRSSLLVVQVQHHLVDRTVRVAVEVLGVQKIGDQDEGFRIDNNAAQDAILCLNIHR